MANKNAKPSFFTLLIRLLAIGCLLFALSAAAGYGIVWGMVKAPEAETPDILTLTVEEAAFRAAARDFAIRIDSREETDLLDPGRVLSQRPGPGTLAKTSSAIRITVSEAP